MDELVEQLRGVDSGASNDAKVIKELEKGGFVVVRCVVWVASEKWL